MRLEIDVADETPETRLRRLIGENPVVIFSRRSCCMCHVMKRLLSALGVHPAVIELDEDEIAAVPRTAEEGGAGDAPAVFIGGARVGGMEDLVALHLSGSLVPKLVDAGAILV